MKLSELNDYAQTGAAVVAIIGIFLLGYEVRQGNGTTIAEFSTDVWSEWTNTRIAFIESGMAAT